MTFKLIKVWHQDSPGMKVWVVRGWFQDFVHPKHFAAVGETTYTGKQHLKSWNALRRVTVLLDRTVKPHLTINVDSEVDIIDYFNDLDSIERRKG